MEKIQSLNLLKTLFLVETENLVKFKALILLKT